MDSSSLVRTVSCYIDRVALRREALAADMRAAAEACLRPLPWTAPEAHIAAYERMLQRLLRLLLADPAAREDRELEAAWSADVIGAWNEFQRARR